MRLKAQRRNKQPEMCGAGISSAEMPGAEARSAETNSAETNSVKMRSAKMRTAQDREAHKRATKIIRIDQASLGSIRLLNT